MSPVTLYTVVSPSVILAHLQVLCVGLHYLGVLVLKNDMQHYHKDMESILSMSTRSRNCLREWEPNNGGHPHSYRDKHDAFDGALPTSGLNLEGPEQERKIGRPGKS